MAKRGQKSQSAFRSGLRLTLEGQVTLQRLGQALDAWTDFLREVGRQVTGSPAKDAVRYVITEAKGGSVTLGVRPQPAQRNVPASLMPRIAKVVTSGIRSLERSPKRPRYFSDTALERLRDLARITGADIPAVKIANGTGGELRLSSRVIKHVEEALAPEVESIGTVEGNLEGLIIHGKRRFLIFDHLTERQVTCYITERVEWETVLKAFGKRVAVSGFVRSRRSGEKVSIQANHLYVFPPDDELPRADAVRGALKLAQ
jgi:hypothetical protein